MLREEKWIGISNHLFKPSSKIVLVECGRCLFYRRFGVRSMGVENMNLKRKNYAFRGLQWMFMYSCSPFLPLTTPSSSLYLNQCFFQTSLPASPRH